MGQNIYDIGIIGAGMAGSFAALKIAKDSTAKTILFDLGRPPMKRRRQLEGWLGCLPNSDGKLYLSDLNRLNDLVGTRKTKAGFNFFNKTLSQIDTYKTIKDKSPSISVEKKLKKINYDISLNDYMQIFPKEIHMLSKHMHDFIEEKGNITYSFDNEIQTVYKQKNMFVIVNEFTEYRCKKLIIAVGRSGWRWAKDLYSNFGIIENNDTARFGIRVELNASYMKDFNKSNCTLTKGNDIEIGPLSWSGTVVPEDHVDVAISAFRSNENRWKTDKVSFALIGNRSFPDGGFEQTDRISKLTFILANDRIIKEKVNSILTGKSSKISIIPEYNWLKGTLEELSTVIPDLSKAYYHIPTIQPLAPKINIGSNLETEIPGMFVVGESAGHVGLLAAATMGSIAATEILK